MPGQQTRQTEHEAFYAELMPGFLEYLGRSASDVDSIELATTLEGVNTLPARMDIGGVVKTVLVPLTLLTKEVDANIAACVAATTAANTAASEASAAAKKVTDSITDIATQKQAFLAAAASANNAASAATTAKNACTNATDACIQATALCEQKTQECADVIASCRAATQECANETANSRVATVAAKNACTNATDACAKATALCEQKTQECADVIASCRAATQECANETANSKVATVVANTAAAKANSEATNLSNLKSACQDVTTRCESTNQTAAEKVVEMESLMKNFSGESQAAPARLVVTAPATISTRNKVAQKISAQLYPSYVMRNILYHREEGSSLKVDPSGNLYVKGYGTTSFYVIPSQNTELWQQVDITVRTPLIRLTGAGKLRLNGGKIRIV